MRRSSSSKPGSARKRQRLSSPTYEEHFPITQDDMYTFDEIERRLSQSISVVPSQSRSLPSEETSDHEVRRRDASGWNIADGILQDWPSSPPGQPSAQDRGEEDDFFSAGAGTGAGFVSAASMSSKPLASPAVLVLSGFTSAAALPADQLPHQPWPAGGFSSESRLEDEGGAPSDSPSFTVAKFGGFGRASALPLRRDDPYLDDRPSSPSEPPAQQDFDSWFDSDASVLPPEALTFKSARKVIGHSATDSPSTSPAPQLAGFSSAASLAQLQQPPDAADAHNSAAAPASMAVGFASAASVGFNSAASLSGGKSSWAPPSAAALALAEQKRKQWDAEYALQDATQDATSSSSGDVENAPLVPSFIAPQPPPASTMFQTPLRPALRPMENSHYSPAQPPETPLASKNPAHYTVVGGLQIKNKQFKSPLISRHIRPSSVPSTRVGSSLKPTSASDICFASGSKLPAAFAFGAASGVTPTTPATPVHHRPSNPASPSKGKALGMTPRRVGGLRPAGKGKFSTPFKSGTMPGAVGRIPLENSQDSQVKVDMHTQTPLRVDCGGVPSWKGKARKEYKFFDINLPLERKTLVSSGLRPQSYTVEELDDVGINVEELRQMQPCNAVYYSFHSPLPRDTLEEPLDPPQLGPAAAFAQLKELGCTLATQEWVTNHYGLILWKLAGMVCLEPEHEQNTRTKRWCWPEVIRQLLYRYERELSGGSRPALRLISTEDAPASCPMVLCVSNIIAWAPAVMDKNGVPFDPHPELEITDGWYRLRAKVDLPLARAVRRGLITVGSKMAVSGARLSGDRKEPCEILDAYDNTYLELTGNSTHLAPWHAKLGFVKDPFIATLDSLTADGGMVPAMDLMISKVYPIAYLEFVRNEDGSTTKAGPRNEKEDLKLHDQWLAKRDMEVAKIRMDLEKKIQVMEKTSDRLHALAGSRFDEKSIRDEPIPDHIEDLYVEMMEESPRPSQSFGRLSPLDAGWLRIHMLDQINLAKERLNEDIEREIQHVCPPRNVRNFRVIVAKDARWHRKEPMRTVQITLWDPLRMIFSEGGTPGDIRGGQRFLVTNLQPNQPSAWMAPGPNSVIYLVSNKNARWTNIKSRKC